MKNLNLVQKIKSFVINHKIWSIIILLAVVVLAYFLFFKASASTETTYVTTEVKKGNVVISVTGSGQIEASDTIDLKPKTTGNISYVGVKTGDIVNKGKLLASIDTRDARLALENAKISLEKLVGDPDSLTLLQKKNALNKLYSDGWNNISSFVIDMNSVVSGLEDLNNGYLGYKNKMLLSKTGKDKIDISEKAYWDAEKSLSSTVALFKSLSRTSSNEEIEGLINKAFDTSKQISNTIKLTQASFDYTFNDLDDSGTTETTSIQNDLSSWTTDTNSYVNSISASLNNIKESILSLEDFLVGADELDVRSAQLSVDNKQEAYNDCFIYAPFDGTVATFTAKVGQSSGSSIGTLITNQKLATISLNEVDIAKIKLDQKATLTFDAIDNLTITGKVAEIDPIGTVSQGVVSYNVSISLDVDDIRVKPGMSVSASIITDTSRDVLVVPNGAVKSQNEINYVQTFDVALTSTASGGQGSPSSVLPKQVEVSIGLVDDTSTEIISGLKEGDIVVTKTITNKTMAGTTIKSTTPSLLGAVGGARMRD